MNTISPKQNKCLHKLLTELNLMRSKTDLILGYTQGRTSSSSEMLGEEAQRIINNLSMELAKKKRAGKIGKMRSRICYTARLIGWIAGNGKTDMCRIDEYCQKYGNGKTLNDHAYEELPKLVFQFEQMKNNYLHPKKQDYDKKTSLFDATQS